MYFLQVMIKFPQITAAVTWLGLVALQLLSRICSISPGIRGNKCMPSESGCSQEW